MSNFQEEDRGSGGRAYAAIVSASCFSVLCIILIAGLWPLRIPRNDVTWLKNKNGLLFGRHGNAVSAGPLGNSNSKDDTSCSLELWLSPSRIDDNKTILSFYGSAHPGDPFSVQQSKTGLRIQRHNVDDHGVSRTAWFMVDRVFRQDEPVFVTITLGHRDTSVYVDGVLARASPFFGESKGSFTGRIVLGDSPTTSYSWSGQILGMAIYDTELTPAQVATDWETWTKTPRPILPKEDIPVALYLFNEGAGGIVHNQIDRATDLMIPSRYSVLHPGFLLTPWREYKNTWSYWQDFGVNVTGFIPFGLCFVAYFSAVRVINRPRAATIVLGFAVSLTIEVLQAFLPTRSSGMTDLMTNTLGTTIGVMLYGRSFVQRFLAELQQRLCRRGSSQLHEKNPTAVSG
jgi:VanZ family protein